MIDRGHGARDAQDNVRVSAFPPTDVAFGVEVRRTASWSTDPQVVVARLRRHYPNAAIRIKDPFAHAGFPDQTWYVFRDGRVLPEDDRRERLYRALAEARVTVATTVRIIDACRVSVDSPPTRAVRI